MAGDNIKEQQKKKTKKKATIRKSRKVQKEQPKKENEHEVGENLTEKQEKFCRNYTQNYEFFRNATLSYAEAYGFDIDSQRTDDATYRLKDGTQVPEYAFKKGKRIRAERISDSSQKMMYDNCSSAGSRLRRNVKIQARCRELLNEFFIDQVIDARMMEIIIDGKDTDAVAAMKEYNALKKRVTKKVELGATDELKEWMEKMNKILDE